MTKDKLEDALFSYSMRNIDLIFISLILFIISIVFSERTIMTSALSLFGLGLGRTIGSLIYNKKESL